MIEGFMYENLIGYIKLLEDISNQFCMMSEDFDGRVGSGRYVNLIEDINDLIWLLHDLLKGELK